MTYEDYGKRYGVVVGWLEIVRVKSGKEFYYPHELDEAIARVNELKKGGYKSARIAQYRLVNDEGCSPYVEFVKTF